jgi:hypothetical protein
MSERYEGIVSLRSSKCFPVNSCYRPASPVILPPGRARLATNPALTGSVRITMTMEMGAALLKRRRAN